MKNSRIHSLAFLADQGLGSLVTFLLFMGVARFSDTEMVGILAVFQAITIVALTASRAIGLDVWVSLGSLASDRRAAAASSLFPLYLLPIVLLGTYLLIGPGSLVVFLYCIACPFVVLMDTARVLLLNMDRSWISAMANLSLVLVLVFNLMFPTNLEFFLTLYVIGVFLASCLSYFFTNVGPVLPSLRYSLINRNRSAAFFSEILLGSIVQQIMFMLIAMLSSLSTAGTLRIAQTLVGPMAVIHGGLAPLLLKSAGKRGTGDILSVQRSGLKSGGIIAIISAVGVGILTVILVVPIQDSNLLYLLMHKSAGDIVPTLVIVGLTLSFNGISLGAGIACRILERTRYLNFWRMGIIPIQIIVVIAASLAGNPEMAATSLLITAIMTAGVSLWILLRSRVIPG